MRVLWPPPSLGLGTLLNLASLAPARRPVLRRWLGLAPLLGVMIVLLTAGIDLAFFRGATIQRIGVGAGGSHPLPASRLFASIFGSVLEELLFRVLLATFVAWLTYLALSVFTARRKLAAQWVGTLAAARHHGSVVAPSR